MSLRFHVVQYIDDPLLSEGRNVAILAYHGGRGHYRALGMDGYRLISSHFKSLSSKARDSVWVYREWIEWFRSLANIRVVEQFDDAIARLATNNSGLVAASEGVIDLTEGHGDASDALDYLFKRLVRAPKITPILEFEDQLESVFNQAEIIYDQNFWDEAVEVEMVDKNERGAVITLEFSHLYSAEFMHQLTTDTPIGFNTLVLQGATQKSLARHIERCATIFKNAVLTGFLQPDHCVLLCGRIEEKHHEMLAQLAGIATGMDVYDESTPSKIRKLVWIYS